MSDDTAAAGIIAQAIARLTTITSANSGGGGGGVSTIGPTTPTTLTPGSVVFAGASTLAQDNANFFWDSTNHVLSVTAVTINGTATAGGLTVSGASATGALTVTGAITATGEITAYYSDARLKENIRPIEDPLQKLLAIRGVRYNANDLAASFGYTKEDQVGVIAQAVKDVLPEAVAPAPFNNEYMTIKYEKLVPLLIEAIRALHTKIEMLENK